MPDKGIGRRIMWEVGQVIVIREYFDQSIRQITDLDRSHNQLIYNFVGDQGKMTQIIIVGLVHDLGVLLSLRHTDDFLQIVWAEPAFAVWSDVDFTDSVAVVVDDWEVVLAGLLLASALSGLFGCGLAWLCWLFGWKGIFDRFEESHGFVGLDHWRAHWTKGWKHHWLEHLLWLPLWKFISIIRMWLNFIQKYSSKLIYWL